MIHIYRKANPLICIFECPTTFGNEQQAWRVSSLSLVIDYGSYVITGRAGTGDDSMGFLLTIMQISNTYGGRPMLRLAQSIYVGNFLAQLMPSTPYWCGGGWRRAAPADCWGRDREGKGQGGREKDEGGRDWEREAYYLQLGVSRVHFCCILWLSCPCCLLFPSVLQFPSLFFLDISNLLFLYSYLFSPFIKQVSFFPSYFFIYLFRPLCLRLPDSYSCPASIFSALCAEVWDYGKIQLWGASLCSCRRARLFIFHFIVIGLFAEGFYLCDILYVSPSPLLL